MENDKDILAELEALEEQRDADFEKLDSLGDIDKLVEVFKVLSALVVSLDRLGHYELWHGREAAKEELSRYMGPTMVERIAVARYLLDTYLDGIDSGILQRLEEMDDSEFGYWDGPESSQPK